MTPTIIPTRTSKAKNLAQLEQKEEESSKKDQFDKVIGTVVSFYSSTRRNTIIKKDSKMTTKSCWGSTRRDWWTLQFVALFLFHVAFSNAFVHQHKPFSSWFRAEIGGRPSSSLHGMPEWRSESLEENRTIIMLPFSTKEALMLPGQSQTIVFKEGRHFDLLEEATEDGHSHVLGTVLMGDDEMLPIFPLCEVTDFTFEIEYKCKLKATVTLKCVGRARLGELKQLKPYMQGKASEVVDDHSNLDIAACNEIVHDIEQLSLQSSTQNAVYQQSFWMALNAIGYTPTSLLTRDPGATNSRKELEAASWASLSLLTEPDQRYQAMACQNVLERLQLVRRALLRKSLEPTSTASEKEDAEASSSAVTDRNNGVSNLYDQTGFE